MEIPMTRNETISLRMRDCFTAGYTLPQYCIEYEIKKPLFIAEKDLIAFAWEIYVQFRYDKRMVAAFSMIDLPTDSVRFCVKNTVDDMRFKNFSEINPAAFDAIILLTVRRVTVTGRVISFVELQDFFIQKVYAEIPALNFLKRYPGVKLFYTILPNLMNRYKGGMAFAQKLDSCMEGFKEKILASKGEHVATLFDKFGYTNQEVLTLNNVGGKITTKLDGTTVMTDNDNPLAQIKNGKRLTAFQPETFQNRIYFVGPCHFIGAWAPFDKTIESYLQQILNENNLSWRVENESQRCVNRYQDMFYNLNTLKPAPGDIVFLWISCNLCSKNLPVLNLSDAFDPPYDYKEIFCLRGHFNELGYKRIAERIFERLTENNFFHNVEFNYHMPPRLSQIRHTSAIRAGRRKFFRQ